MSIKNIFLWQLSARSVGEKYGLGYLQATFVLVVLEIRMKSTIALGYVSRLVSMLGGIIVLPFIIKYLDRSEFSVWMIFVAASSLVNVLDFGFMSSFSRYFNYIYGGAKTLRGVGVIKMQVGGERSYALLRTVYDYTVKTYAVLGGIFVVCSFVIYFFYLLPVFQDNKVDFSAEWTVFSLSIAINIFFLYYSAVLAGIDRLEISYVANIVSGLLFMFFGVCITFYGGGLMGLCVAKLISVVAYRVFCYLKLRKNNEYQRILSAIPQVERMTELYQGAFKIGLSTLGNFLTNRASTFIVVSFLPLAEAGEFALALMLFATLVSVSMIALNSYIPKLARAYTGREARLFRESALFSYFVANALFIVGSVAIVLVLPYFLELLVSKNKLPGLKVLLLIALTYFFEMNQQVATTIMTVVNNLSYVYGVFVFGVVYVFLCGFALWSIEASMVVAILSQMVSQMLFNNWYWPYKAFRVYRGL